ncbi:response regulator transcription factor [Flagellimonas sp. HMM57]|uniref:response regulator transcription factor n=1 Tax=unclassified Flagellimonas TaxID=2644544 RepID=UPI0013D4A96C|nr:MULTISPECIES: response regulator transcription factor [unclassified Flagellimonas]UII77778.1 response regulator transcription factor [Flagellimonas sp. HMM57]
METVLNNAIQIVLADDHALVRDGIRALLEEENNLQVIGEVSNGTEAMAMVAEKQPDILIIDIRMPEMGGIEAVEKLNARNTKTKCIILSMHDSEEYILKSVKAGANGYLLKDTDKNEFIKAIRTVDEGGKYFSGDISNVLVNNLFGQGQAANKVNLSKSSKANAFDLTNKELQVLELILSGYTSKEISEQLQNSKRTIETHRFNLMRKMEVKNLIELSKKAREAGLV